MLRWVLILLFVGLPLIELYLLTRVWQWAGPWQTVALVLVTGVVGGSLAHQQGLTVLRRMQARLAAGHAPGSELGHGVLILAAGLLLITPGIITDAVGTLLLVPPIRSLVGRLLFRFLARHARGHVTFVQYSSTVVERDDPARRAKDIDVRIVEREPGDGTNQEDTDDDTSGLRLPPWVDGGGPDRSGSRSGPG